MFFCKIIKVKYLIINDNWKTGFRSPLEPIFPLRKINECNIFVGKSEGKRPLEIPRCRGEDNIRTDLRERGRKFWTGFIWVSIGTSGIK
jgi:hypothetical protein